MRMSKRKKKILVIGGIAVIGVLLYMNSKGMLPGLSLPGFTSGGSGSASKPPVPSYSSSGGSSSIPAPNYPKRASDRGGLSVP